MFRSNGSLDALNGSNNTSKINYASTDSSAVILVAHFRLLELFRTSFKNLERRVATPLRLEAQGIERQIWIDGAVSRNMLS